MMDQHHARKRTRPKWAGEIGIDLVTAPALDGDRFGQNTFVHIGLVHAWLSFLDYCYQFYSRITRAIIDASGAEINFFLNEPEKVSAKAGGKSPEIEVFAGVTHPQTPQFRHSSAHG
jgi:hypothetical protein